MIKIMFLFKTILFYIFIFLLLSESPVVFAFGPNGHRIVARIAENHLSPAAKNKLSKITGKKFLSQLATWPDEIRSNKDWNYAKPWHFLSIDDNESFDSFKRNKKGDVLEALIRFEKILRDQNTKQEKKWQALAFYIHFMGDIHQPLHVGRRDDLGGNKIKIKWFNHFTNLHSVWDVELIKNQVLSFREYASFLGSVSVAQKKQWLTADYLDYAKESKNIRSIVYDFGKQKLKPPSLGYQYNYLKINILNERLLKAGIRLAARLNSIFSD